MKNVFKVLMYFCFAIGFLYSAVFFYNEMRVVSTSMDKKIFSNIMVVIYLFLIIVAFVTVSAHIYYMDMNNIMDVCFGVISFILAGICGIAVLLLEVSGKNK